jgi:hypothetical protein
LRLKWNFKKKAFKPHKTVKPAARHEYWVERHFFWKNDRTWIKNGTCAANDPGNPVVIGDKNRSVENT